MGKVELVTSVASPPASPALTSRSCPFMDMKNLQDLASFLDIPAKKLAYLAYVLKDHEKYTLFDIPKKSGGTRNIAAPNPDLKKVQRRIADALLEKYGLKDGVHGYLKDRSIVTNAKAHLRKRYLLNFDLEDFYPSINFGRVRGLFLAHPFNFPESVATALARICTKDNFLPQGAPSSPIISNYVCWGLDNYLRKYCFRLGCTYTRYADDISISTNRENFPNALAVITHDPYTAKLSDALTGIIHKNGFRVNDSKTRFATNAQSQVVTGLKVNQFSNVSRKYVRQVRAMLNAWERYGLEKAEAEYRSKYRSKTRAPFLPNISYKQVLHGKLMFLRSVRGCEDKLYQKLLGRYSLVANLKKLTQFGFPKQINRALWILESKVFEDDYAQGTGFDLEGIGVVTCAHVIKPNTKARRMYNHGEELDIKIIEKDDERDYAIIQIIGAEEEVVLEPDLGFAHTISAPIRTAGYPAHDDFASVAYEDGVITQVRRSKAGHLWYRVNTHIVAGSSGGPVLNSQMKVIGIVAFGAQSLATEGEAANNGYIPLTCLNGAE